MPHIVAPSARYHASWVEAAAEWGGEYMEGHNEPEQGVAAMADREAFTGYVERLLRGGDPSWPQPEGRVPASTLWAVDGERFLGSLSLRHSLNDFLAVWGGHIGYGVRPSARRQGVATFLLRGALEHCARLGIDRALVTCDDDNPGSYRTIEACGGVLENVLPVQADMVDAGFDKPLRRYWIDVPALA